MQITLKKEHGFGLVGWIVTLMIIGGVGYAGYWFFLRKEDVPTEYHTAIVGRGDLVQLVTATGQLNPRTNVVVGSQVSGIISKLYVDFNSPVTNNQLVAELDPSIYSAVVAGAKADVASAQAALELARANADRAKALFEKKIMSQADYDSTSAVLHQAEALVQQKTASLQQAQVNLDHTLIYAPVAGTVISRNVDVGQTVAASLSAPILFQIANDLAKMQIDALISEADIGVVATNQNVNFTVDAFPARTFTGVVEQIRNAAQTNQNVITYDTVIGVENPELKLRPGMTANVSVITATRTNVLKLPNAALRFRPSETTEVKKDESSSTNASTAGIESQTTGAKGDGQGHGNGHKKNSEKRYGTVYLMEKVGVERKVVLREVKVRIGINDGIFTQVMDGLKEGDEVVESEFVSGGSASGAPGSPFSGGRRF